MNIKEVLTNHKKWLSNEDGGKKAYLRDAYLRDADLRGVNLRDADLQGANLYGVNLRDAYLQGANLYGANLYGADLQGANLQGANLRDADLQGANLYGADLRGADLRDADLQGANLQGANLRDAAYYFAQCPESGSFTAWKKCKNGVIVKLLIPASAKRSSATSRKCRASKAKCIAIYGAEIAFSSYDDNFKYEVGKTYTVDDFCEDRWKECAEGIHFFITREEAENY